MMMLKNDFFDQGKQIARHGTQNVHKTPTTATTTITILVVVAALVVIIILQQEDRQGSLRCLKRGLYQTFLQ